MTKELRLPTEDEIVVIMDNVNQAAEKRIQEQNPDFTLPVYTREQKINDYWRFIAWAFDRMTHPRNPLFRIFRDEYELEQWKPYMLRNPNEPIVHLQAKLELWRREQFE